MGYQDQISGGIMRILILGFLVFANSAFAGLDIDLTGSQVSITGPTTLDIKNVKMGNLLPTVDVKLVWNSVTSSFVIFDPNKPRPVGGDYVGKWKITLQYACKDNYNDWMDIEVRQDGTVDFRGEAGTWSNTNGRLDMKWTNFPQYTIYADLINDELVGQISDASQKWCMKGTRIN